MPTRNALKVFAPEQYYHVYTRGVAKQRVFLDDEDYQMFLSFIKRYLSKKPVTAPNRHPYPHYYGRLELLAYCLMPNHIHLLFYENDEAAITDLMRSLMTSYSLYFNKKYQRVGHLFQSRYLASRIDRDNYLQHISRYIHLNPKDWQRYPYSSLPYYRHEKHAEWLVPERILLLFKNNSKEYEKFLADYESHKLMLDELKWELAHS